MENNKMSHEDMCNEFREVTHFARFFKGVLGNSGNELRSLLLHTDMLPLVLYANGTLDVSQLEGGEGVYIYGEAENSENSLHRVFELITQTVYGSIWNYSNSNLVYVVDCNKTKLEEVKQKNDCVRALCVINADECEDVNRFIEELKDAGKGLVLYFLVHQSSGEKVLLNIPTVEFETHLSLEGPYYELDGKKYYYKV